MLARRRRVRRRQLGYEICKCIHQFVVYTLGYFYRGYHALYLATRGGFAKVLVVCLV
jgi:hypothetical protein